MKSKALLKLGIATVALGVIGTAFALPWLVSKLRHRNITSVRLIAQIQAPEVEINGETLRIERIPDLEGQFEPQEGDPDAVLRVHWRGQTHDFAMGHNISPMEPGLRKYAWWFGVLLLADGAATAEEFEHMWTAEGGPEPILTVAAWYPAPGYDAGTWGEVRRKEWVYEYARLRFDGPDEEAIVVSKKPYEAVDALLLPGKYTNKEFIPTPEERERDLWQYYAATYITPPAHMRGRNKVLEPLMHDMGLAWPASGVSILAILIGVLMIGMARRERIGDPFA